MESHLINAQVQELKTRLVRVILSSNVNDPEMKEFSNIVVFAYMGNPDFVCNVYGIKQGVLAFDCMNSSLQALDLNALPIECLIKIKEEMENFEKGKQYSK